MKCRIVLAFLLACVHTQLIAFSFLGDQQMKNEQVSGDSSEYPMILHHGLFGFRKILFLEYFNKVPETLRNAGYKVFVTRVYPLGDIERRSRELGEQIDEILRITGKDKVNLIGHSMGGLDARYLADNPEYTDKIASITMVGTPNRGSYFADIAAGLFGRISQAKNWLLQAIGLDPDQDGLIEQAMQAVYNCSEEFIQGRFNTRIFNQSGIYYQSWAGVSSVGGMSTDDVLSPFFLLPFSIIKVKDGENDGLVSVRSARWGNYRGVMQADHLDQVGFSVIDSSGSTGKFRHKRFYHSIASGLARMGF